MESYQKETFKEKIKRNTKKGLVAGATALSTFGSNAMAATSTETVSENSENKDIKATERVVAAKPDIFSENTTTPEGAVDGLAYMSPEKTGDDDKKESKETSTTHESVTLDLAAYFETGSAKLKEADIEKIKTDFSGYLESLPDEVKDNLQSGEMTIVVEASSSPAPIKSAITETVNGVENVYTNNESLSRARANSPLPYLEEILAEKGLQNIHLEVYVPKGGVAESKEKKVSIRAEYNHELYKKIFKESFDANTLMVIMDESGSMLDKRDAANEVVAGLNESRETPIEITVLQGGSTEAHLQTMEDVIAAAEKQDTPKYIYVITDEMDETIEDTDPSTAEGLANIKEYKNRIREVIAEGQKKNINFVVHYMNNGITKTTAFADNPDVLLDDEPMVVVKDGVIRF